MGIVGRDRREMLPGVTGAAAFLQDDAQLVVSVGIHGLDSQNFFEARDGFFIAMLGLVNHSQVVLGVGQVGIDVAGALEEDDGGVRAALAVGGDTQVVHHDRL